MSSNADGRTSTNEGRRADAGRPTNADGQTSTNAEVDLIAPSDLLRLLELEFDELTPTRVTGSVAADERHHQPWGLVHGGLYTAAIETFATVGAVEAIKDRGQLAVGVNNVTDFLRPHRSGRLRVTATAIQQGRSQQLWQVEIRRPKDEKLVARGQVRLQNVEADR
jgi:1,4-dihydroxy-2-naphthoyl-CoA hydrolase